jgi:chromosome partitioning protein
MATSKIRKIAVANEKGGVGKTATIINLGAALSLKGHRVLIVDVDPQFNATLGLGQPPEAIAVSVYDLIQSPGATAAREAVVNTRWQGLDLIPSVSDLAGAEVELVDVVGRENRLREGLAGLDGGYDFILLDTPPSLSLLTVNVFAYADELLVPCQTHPYAFGALRELFGTVGAIRRGINPKLEIKGVVATFFDQRTRVSNNTLQKLKDDATYGPLLFQTVIRANTTVAESADVGKPVVFYRPGSFGAQDYLKLADELIQRQ